MITIPSIPWKLTIVTAIELGYNINTVSLLQGPISYDIASTSAVREGEYNQSLSA